MIYVLAALATYYGALSITSQDGPFNVFQWLRNQFTQDDWIGRGVRCIVCMSCWVGLAVVAWLVGWGQAALIDLPIVWLGLAGASVVLDRYWKR